MKHIIEQLKEQREKAKHKFVEMSIIKRYCKEDGPIPDTDSYLDEIMARDEAISVLENHLQNKLTESLLDHTNSYTYYPQEHKTIFNTKEK